MPRNLLEQIRKAMQLAADHRLEIEALCLATDDLHALEMAGVGENELGVRIKGSCTQGMSAVCAVFRGDPVAIELNDYPFVGPRS